MPPGESPRPAAPARRRSASNAVEEVLGTLKDRLVHTAHGPRCSPRVLTAAVLLPRRRRSGGTATGHRDRAGRQPGDPGLSPTSLALEPHPTRSYLGDTRIPKTQRSAEDCPPATRRLARAGTPGRRYHCKAPVRYPTAGMPSTTVYRLWSARPGNSYWFGDRFLGPAHPGHVFGRRADVQDGGCCPAASAPRAVPGGTRRSS